MLCHNITQAMKWTCGLKQNRAEALCYNGFTMSQTQDPFQPHDHAHCAADVIAHAEQHVAKSGARLTPVRRRALEVLLEQHRAMGAYDVLERLALDGFGNQPPVAYRALDFLVEHGLAHRISARNAFAACMHPGHSHAAVFLICKGCDRLAEADAAPIHAAISKAGDRAGFTVEQTVVEAIGLCAHCKAA
jgi:Fur family zinc uptake transcriptional regulator